MSTRGRGGVSRWSAAASAALALACGADARKPPTEADDFVAPMPAAPPPRPRRGRSRPARGPELRAIDDLARVAERVRGLPLKRAVPVLVQDAEAIADFVDRELDAEELERARAIYVALGLLDPALDVRALLLRLMAEQIVGYYDTWNAHLAVREEVMRALRQAAPDAEDATSDLIEARVVLVHELVHALQDQHLGLRAAVDATRDTDRDNALRALIEGDAYLAMLAAAYEDASLPLSALTAQPEFRRMLADAFRDLPFAGEEELTRAPAIVRVPLLSAYVDGLGYAVALHAEGGWGRIDRAHADPPVSTEQILHPERSDGAEVPVEVVWPGVEALLAPAGYRLFHQDTLGELELGVYFAQGTPDDRAPLAADGWGGDRLYAFRTTAGGSSEMPVVWTTAWDSDTDAIEAAQAARRIHEALPPDARTRSLVARSGRRVLIARNLPVNLHANFRAAFDAVARAPVTPDGAAR